MEAKAISASGLRLFLSVNRGAGAKRNERLDITDFVVELGPLCCGGGEAGGEPQAESVRLRLFGDERFNPRKPKSPPYDYGTVYLDIYKDGEYVFFGALAGTSRPDEAAERETITFEFVGGLKELWPSSTDDFADSEIAYADVERDVWPLLLASAELPVTDSTVELPPIKTEEDVWSATARPHIELPGYDAAQTKSWDIIYPVTGEGLVYAGFGPFLLSHEEMTGEWKAVAKVAADDDVEWFITHLEYDASRDEVCGVVAGNEDDVTGRNAHLRATFSLGV
ncbi:MAG: hypothetical protein GY771_14090 [bacterium]|nr:hypothetical protein [bacterium]